MKAQVVQHGESCILGFSLRQVRETNTDGSLTYCSNIYEPAASDQLHVILATFSQVSNDPRQQAVLSSPAPFHTPYYTTSQLA